MLLDILWLLIGFIALIYGADKLVDGGSALAIRLNIPNIVIGLTIVAFGTSAPELVVNLISSFEGQSALAFGNVMGSNIFNILAILGLTAIIYPVGIKKNTIRIEIPLTFLAAILVLIMFMNQHWSDPPQYIITRWEGIILLIFFCGFMAYTIHLAKKGENEEIPIKHYSVLKSVLLIVLGLAGLIIGGQLLVRGAVNIAESLGVSQRIIAITIVSVGTSLPELATSIVAARKKNVDMAVGNVVGSNLFNTFLVLGASATVMPVRVTWESITDVTVNILASLLLFMFIFFSKKQQLGRWSGSLLLLVYVAYIIFLILRR
ncbi:MAG: calcium/sodium antiporter [Bacteroidales bacterium]|jgi:cation:H+ antiporter|nr:calcium/sodium antiporter [Bacteroidales bacterium]